MKEAYNALNDWLEERLLQLHTGFFAKVISYDESSRRAVIQPLQKRKELGFEAEDYAVIQNVPVTSQRFRINGVEYMCPLILKEGDTVYASCAQREIDNVLNGQSRLPSSFRRHSMNDAVITAVVL